MEYTKKALSDIAYQLCMPLINRTARRRKESTTGFALDRAGYACSELENLCRGLMGIAPVTADRDICVCDGAQEQPLLEWWKTTLLEGCDDTKGTCFERGRKSMGDHFFYNQSITEICCMLVFSYFAREQFWDRLTQQEKDLLAGKMLVWSEKALADSWQNNHLWFPILSLVVLKRLGYPSVGYVENITQALGVLDGMYIGDGWYQDGAFGRFDYYVAWSLHLYPLWWSVLEEEDFPGFLERRAEYRQRTERFLPYFMHWFDANGANVLFGRSLSYRFAAVALIPAAAMAGCQFDFGSGKKLMFDNISYYLDNCHIPEDGVLPPGIFYDNRAFVESYTSDGGAYWCAKTFFALFLPDQHPFWTSSTAPYPAQQKSYLIWPENKKLHLLFAHQKDCGVTLYNSTAHYQQNGVFLHPFNDMAGYYSKFAYNSKAGFSLSCRDLLSFDCMISLETADHTMQSHRLGFVDCGEKNGVLYSRHIPFRNDEKTGIDTALLPLEDGIHALVHRVVLQQPYVLREGGFSIPFYEDNFLFEQTSDGDACVKTPALVSRQKYLAQVPATQRMEMPKPGNHAYAPMCGYPIYETALLEPGTYWFASAYYIGERTDNPLAKVLFTSLSGNRGMVVHTENREETIDFSFSNTP